MASILDSAVLVGKETVYGTPVTPTRAYEAKADTFKREVQFLESVGMRAGMHAGLKQRRRMITLGATGEIEFDVLTNGAGMLLQGMLGSSTAPVSAAGGSFKSTHTSTNNELATAFTVQVQRPMIDSTIKPFTYHGATITEWSINQEVDGLLGIKFSFDAEDEDTVTASASPSSLYPSGAATVPYDWTQCVVTINGSTVEVDDFSLDGKLGLKTDRRFLKGSRLKGQPKRTSVPQFSGSMTAEFRDTTLYDLFVAGTPVAVTATWTGSLIGGGINYAFKITLPACQFEGTSPNASLDDLARVELPFTVLHDIEGGLPAVTIEYTSTDAAL